MSVEVADRPSASVLIRALVSSSALGEGPSRMRKKALTFLVALAVASTMTRAWAAKEPGRDELEQGVRLYKIEHYEAAVLWLRQAYEKSDHSPPSVVALAKCERSLKLYDEALQHFREYLETNPPEKEARAIRETIAELEPLQGSSQKRGGY